MKRMISFVLLVAVLLTGSVIPAHAVNGSDFIYSSGNKLKRGFSTDNLYMNVGFHFAVQFDDDWDLFSEEQLIKENNTSNENYDMDELFDRNGIITDMIANNKTYPGSNVIIVIENMKVTGGTITEKEYCRSMEKHVADQYSKQGYEVEKSKQDMISFAGADHQSVYFEMTINNRKVYQRGIVLVEDDYAAIVSVATPEESFLDDMISLFYNTDSKH